MCYNVQKIYDEDKIDADHYWGLQCDYSDQATWKKIDQSQWYANWEQKIAKYFRKRPITLKLKFGTVIADRDLSGNCHVYDWLLSILNFEQNI